MSQASPINFTRGVPADESYPLDDLLDAARAALEAHGAAALRYGPSTGFAPLRDWLAAWQGVATEQVLIANGSLQVIEFVCLALLSPGALVVTESPTYDRALTLLRRHGMRVAGVPLEPDGPELGALERLFARERPALFYTIPDFQNPSGATCSGEKRRRIVALAERHGVLVLEDAPYRVLRYRGTDEPTLLALAPERTLHMSSFTKLLAPGVRMGYVLGPPPLVAKLSKAAEDTYISPGYLAEAITYEWCRRGRVEPQIARLRALYAPRLDACLDAIDRHLPAARPTRPEGGFFLSVTLPEGVATRAVRERAQHYALNLADGEAFFPEGGGERFLRLPYCALTPAEIDEGVRRLARAVADVAR
ncbi:MAG TPA: PLP-dependent aminotransferase family protein [Candidatus Limnocylindria bacterium]|nr:PLP-dependent aminotransferase family protein [Candidatus Limnocylindria bacterium]